VLSQGHYIPGGTRPAALLVHPLNRASANGRGRNRGGLDGGGMGMGMGPTNIEITVVNYE